MKQFLFKPLLFLIFSAIFVVGNCKIMAEEKYPLKINVFAVVSENIQNEFLEAANKLYEEDNIDTFPRQGFQIHCTLYMTAYDRKVKNTLIQRVEDFAKTQEQFPVITSGLEPTTNNWFFMNLKVNDQLQLLSNNIVSLISDLRAKSDYIPQWAKEFPAKVENIKLYGSPNVYEQFEPHLTFLAQADIQTLEAYCLRHANSSFAQPIKGSVVAVGVGIADRFGQVESPIKIFPLTKK